MCIFEVLSEKRRDGGERQERVWDECCVGTFCQ